MRPLLQTRSRETLGRLVAATEALLARRSFEDVGIAEIASTAGVTTGAIYMRFPDKDSLLIAVHQNLADAIAPDIARILDPARWSARSLEQSLHELFSRTIEIYRKHAGVIRALTSRARVNPELRARLETDNAARIAALTRCVLASPGASRGPRPELRVHLALLMTTGALREAILFREFWPGGFDVSDKWLARELARGFIGYLEATPPRGKQGKLRQR